MTEEEQTEETQETTPPPDTAPTETPDAAPEPSTDPRYSVGEWSGLPYYKCTFCPMGLLDRGAILEHVYQRHERVNAPQPSGLILDASGNPIT